MRVFVPFWGGNTNWTKNGAHCFLHNFNRTKKTLKPLFFSSALAFVVKQQTRLLQKTQKSKKNTNCALVFFVSKNGFVSKVNWWCLKRTLYFCRSGRFFVLVFKALSFLFWPCLLLVFLVLVFSLCLLDVVSYIKFLCSGSCICCFGIPWFYSALSFGFIFVFGFVFFWMVCHLTWP